jgi:hypothetical protein
MESISRYTHKDLGRVEDRSILASDGEQIFHRHESNSIDRPANFVGRSLTSFGLYTGDSYLGGTVLTGMPMQTGGFTKDKKEEQRWGLLERTGLHLEGYNSGNEGQTVLELLLKAKKIEVSKEKLGESDCFRISNKDEWGAITVWIEATGPNRLIQWESLKERGNRFSGSRHGEHRDTSNHESTGNRVANIQYRDFDGIPIAVRGTIVYFRTPNGGQKEHFSSECERTSVVLNPDFSKESLFQPLFAENARISDSDSFDVDSYFRWRGGQLVRVGEKESR